ncbi:MAG: hypothetical protein JNN24_03305 [Hyphomicrobium zavarzinii]|jgi:hypothetical protein|uniref:hypothetical protein n=1 Tax=Hyphomicrobium zavarzinii TaxID=48292 RepID=UPI001A57E257|nr:hypothetical protein [Hyphomicrobium zavarzinii]MBL8844777.1 hypothetical protein [Hyphomicrobium zavarzinii]
MSPATLAATLTQAELAAPFVLAPPDETPLPRITREQIREVEWANPLWRGPISTLTDENRAVRLLLACGAVVEGWMSRRFLGRATFWTWDPRFARITNFLVGETPRILPGVVEPVAWTELEGDEGE